MLNRYIPESYEVIDYPQYHALLGIKDRCAIGYESYRKTPIFNFRFQNNEQRDKYIKDWLEGLQRRYAEKLRYQEARKNFVNNFKVGDIVYDSWGYDQTNIDFYQVIEVKPKSVVIRRLKQTTTEDSFMSGLTFPLVNEFDGEPILKKLVGHPSDNGTAVGIIKSNYGWFNMWDGQPKRCSWYA
jgi:hypothetical protein